MKQHPAAWIKDFILKREYTAQTLEDSVAVALMRRDLKLATKLWEAGRIEREQADNRGRLS